ncbi:MAG: purine-nucleoside/S-methyl-5-thioadenosine phosphorylase / adenosine deaminase [Frankiales bacterium]|nr:purine-nucleoside/S-methyl-5-thioadenosine phosphorylase / adenosine deaminase [Frankiales bacterium]
MSGPVQLTPVALGQGVGAAFSTRLGGVSAPPWDELNLAYHVDDDWDRAFANRHLLAAAIGQPFLRCCYVHQVHGDAVVGVAEHHVGTVKTRGGRRDGDAMVTRAVGAPLVIMVADCVPVLLADPEARVVAGVHAGRKGVQADIVGKAVAVMREAGATDISAAIGPSVCPGCYEVPGAMAAEVDAAVPGTAARTRTGTPSLDLAAGVASQLAAAGVRRVARDGRCTVESPELFSHRRDGVTGRFAGVVWLEP